ncbi:DNA translocase FtsK [Rossellomorea aquimaris]|nr:DNA translocase FtsK [Rossellomorea aquimaris]
MVSWIKKMFGKLSDDDGQFEEFHDEKNEVQKLDDYKKTERKHIAGPSHSRDVEARMTYQYPKGNFRFPLISDGEKREGQRPNRKRRNQEQEEPAKGQKEKKHYQAPPESRNWNVEKTSAPDKTKKSTKVEKGNSRPFTPTEIPSPIYGFRGRPVKKEDQVEFELKKFLHNDEDSTEMMMDHNGMTFAEESIPEEKEPIVEPVKVEKNQSDSLKGTIPSSVESQEEREQEEMKTVTEWTTEVGEHEGVEEDPGKSDERISLISEIEEPLHHSASERERNKPESETADLSIHSQLKEEVEPLETDLIEDPVVQSTPPVEENPGVVEEAASEEKEPQKRTRSHLPFNVLMLNQDKRQLNARKRERVQKETGSQPTHQPSTRTGNEQAQPEVPEEKVDEGITQQEKAKISEPGPVQGEDAVKSYSELSSSSKRTKDYVFPEMDYLMPPVSKEMSGEWLDSQRMLLDETLHNFNVRAKVVNVTQGPSVTRFEVQPEPGVKVNKITNLSDDIKLSLAARDIRIEAPIPGKHTIGIEVPNRESRPVCISEVIASPAFQEPSSPLTAALGLDISGQPIVTDLSKMPHGLIAGATGSGKSVCINSILVSLLYKASPDELKLLLIDPKMVELAPYNRIPHLVSPVITDVKAATAALKWAVEEMERRYELFAHTGVRDIKRFNELAKRNKQYSDMLPYLVIVIDELADLMMMSPADVEEAICRIAQKARACGIHLIIATQRPSVDVITGLIKANVPTRVAFSVSSGVDSRTIIDGSGAERLLGKGDMLFLENGSSKPVRLQGTFVSDDEIDDIINHVREQRDPDYLFEQDELIKKAQVTEEEDELFLEACEFVVDQGGASASALQRRFRIGYNRAARLMEMMEGNGIISESRGSKPRDVLISESELETLA